LSAYVPKHFPEKFGRIANFRISTYADYKEWLSFKENCKSQGLNICHVLICMIKAWNKGIQGKMEAEKIVTARSVIHLQMQNSFVYQPQRPRREPDPQLIRSRKPFARTVGGMAAQLYLLWKVSDLERPFSYLDLAELPPNYVRKLILRLRAKSWIKPSPTRTKPMFYYLTRLLRLEIVEPFMPRKFRVKQKFSPPQSGEFADGGVEP